MDHFFRKSLITVITNFLLLCFISQAQAQNKVVVVPLFGEGEGADISNVVTVALEGGDFTSPIAAMNSINDASADNPYLIAIAPGSYTISETLDVKPNVSIIGSGQSSTVIESDENVRTTIEITEFNSNLTMSHFTVLNNSGYDGPCTGIMDGTGVRLTNITVEVSGCSSSNTAIVSSQGDSLINNITASVSGGATASGIYVNSSAPITLKNVDIQVGSASVSNVGIKLFFDGGDIAILNSSISVNSFFSNGEAIGIDSIGFDSTEPTTRLADSVINTNGTGVSIADSKMIIRNSSIGGQATSLQADSSSTFIVSSSSLIGGVSGAGNKKCANSDNGEGEELTSACLEN